MLNLCKASDILRLNSGEESLIGHWDAQPVISRESQSFFGFTLPSYFDKVKTVYFTTGRKIYSPPQGYFDGIIKGFYVDEDTYSNMTIYDELTLCVGGVILSRMTKEYLIKTVVNEKEMYEIPFFENPFVIHANTLEHHSITIKKNYFEIMSFENLYLDFEKKPFEYLKESSAKFVYYKVLGEESCILKLGYMCGMVGVYTKKDGTTYDTEYEKQHKNNISLEQVL